MSGHSKWSTIKHQKAANDAKRGKLFSKLSKEITVAVKEGGGPDVGSNAKLRMVMEKAKSVNMPKENIKRAIEKGEGKGGGAALETIIYEGFGPGNISLVVECVTDNKNRCNQEIRSYFDKNAGRLGSSGAASYLFDKKGWLNVEKKGNEEEQALKLIDCGADDLETEDDKSISVYTEPEEFHRSANAIKNAGFVIIQAELVLKPKAVKNIESGLVERVARFLEGLDDLEDVQQVFTDAGI